MAQENRQLHLGAFLQGVGHHLAAWRHPDVDPAAATRFEAYREQARLAERGKFDAIFFADTVGFPEGPPELLAKGALPYAFEPLTLLAALAGATERIGLVATVSTTYLAPFHLARKFASLDHLSAGRAGWNLVTSGTDWEARAFGLEQQVAHAERYRRAREYVEVVKGLWDSFGDDPYLFDKTAGNYFDAAKLNFLEHRGEYFRVRAALQSARPPQGYPVLIQAGSSDDGQELAAATAEVVFTAQQTLADGQRFYRSLKDRLERHGRPRTALKVLPGVLPIVGASESEAREKFEQLQSLIDPVVGIGLLSALIGNIDLSRHPLDAPFPEVSAGEGWQSRVQLFVDMARREQLTLRQVYQRVAGARGHRVLWGTAQHIADELEAWFTQEAADGFNVLPPTLPQGLRDFVEQVIPELQRRGLFRTEYSGRTLREHLGLARPPSRYA
ncbi:nitrilotriacetate monooxygenase [Rubrivivax gelatinosus]|uniref:Nitrilotriacetate monooxygenase n=1 Tax=Rubrivivax gelatinosus TaxID=28068 RepID=A0ABS1DZR8_RUBGE|nr:LLM class flavin-dependent oxidoreductase [Rubrivivax gelatinosus]MBK1615801.1 nitrilotriacetate monooxygenase [Rubrivivax gelatinosus]MBK1715008.1 nitrilotriacetate monooxygenase [Rubrivivax gelatinosus]MBZ8143279.1 nitrilotriacetate monooxygenase [Rubrivivax gelatinosus]